MLEKFNLNAKSTLFIVVLIGIAVAVIAGFAM